MTFLKITLLLLDHTQSSNVYFVLEVFKQDFELRKMSVIPPVNKPYINEVTLTEENYI